MKQKNPLLTLLLLCCSVALCLVALEIGLRWGKVRVRSVNGQQLHLKRWARPDPVLGWTANPGIWEVDCEQRPMTILDNATRKTCFQPGASKNILIVGGSWIQGYGVRDEETCASQLQQRFSSVNFVNLATAGYGNYQSYLATKSFLEKSGAESVSMVILAVAEHSSVRDVADYAWIRSLLTYSGTHFIPPRIAPGPKNLSDAPWLEYPPESPNLWRLADKLDIVLCLQEMLMCFKTRNRYATYGDKAATQVIGWLWPYLKERGVELVVIDLFGAERVDKELGAYCRTNGLPYLRARGDIPDNDPEWYLHRGKCKGHPNEKYQGLWAATLGDYLAGQGLR